MALIICPDCGKKVSDKAATCPDCGCPIASLNPSGPVRIKIANGLLGDVTVFKIKDLTILWQGKAGQIAAFDVEEETEIGVVWGIGRPKANVDAKETVKGGDKLQLVQRTGWLGLSSSFVLNKVDVIDAD